MEERDIEVATSNAYRIHLFAHISIESGYIKNILGNQPGIHILDNSDIIGVPDEVEESDCIIHQVR